MLDENIYTFWDACREITEGCTTDRDRGARFERLIAAWLRIDSYWSKEVDVVWLWEDFARQLKKDLQPGVFTNQDMGIDLVARMKNGEFMAVQCKLYGRDTVMSKSAVDSFISECGKVFVLSDGAHAFSIGLWVHSGGRFGTNAMDAFRGQGAVKFTLVSGDMLAAMEGIDWKALVGGTPVQRMQKKLLPHQEKALEAAHTHFVEHDRGTLVMACGTGKTYTSLKLVEQELKEKEHALVLFLVPSIALLGQSMNAWLADGDPARNMRAVCVCSDATASRKTGGEEDAVEDGVLDLPFPASTNASTILENLRVSRNAGMVTVFSTYQSLGVVHEAQKLAAKDKDLDGWGGAFDFIVCDEAHRTTGTTGKKQEASSFVMIHDGEYIRGAKRLYMTATPRLYKESAKKKAEEAQTVVWSMDDEKSFGKEFYRVGFGYAVDKGLLTDYKVLILTVPAAVAELPKELAAGVEDPGRTEINVDLASQLTGAVSAMSKLIAGDRATWDADPGIMRRALVFCDRIGRVDMPGSSKNVAALLPAVADACSGRLSDEQKERLVRIKAKHVDGSMGADVRNSALAWLREEPEDPQESRVLCNVRCLSEGIDVPALDAVIYLAPRRSEIDVVQSVGRIMRNFRKGQDGEKRFGYVILPVVIPGGASPKDALDRNERFKVVWEILNALRAHDDRFNATVNQLHLNEKKPSRIVIGPGGGGGDGTGDGEEIPPEAVQFREFLYAKVVEKVGNRTYWDDWAASVGGVAQKLIGRIRELLEISGEHREVFDAFMDALHENLNPSVSEDQAVEMLAQNMITAPVFNALFPEYRFDENNAVSRAMGIVIEKLKDRGLLKDTAILDSFYESVGMNVGQIDNLAGKQTVIKNLYERFFKRAFPLTVEKLGIAYTPVPLVDFILRSAEKVLQKEFGASMSDENVHVLDPFTGTGTFIARLLQLGIVRSGDLQRKYRSEIHANEIVLLAYYVADVNVENTFNDIWRRGHPGAPYERFNGIVLTDTFEQHEKTVRKGGKVVAPSGTRLVMAKTALRLPGIDKPLLGENAEQIARQRKAPVRVIVGNPPYSVGQKSANDNAENQKYEHLDGRIAETYAAETKATNRNSLYDTYIKAFRWASDRLRAEDGGGLIAFVSNAGWLDGKAMNGMRRCLEEEFSSIYVVNLRGDCRRTAGELRRKEGGNVFGQSSRTPVAVTILVKKPKHKGKATIRYFEVEDYMTEEAKLKLLEDSQDLSSLPMQDLEPDGHGDWLNQRDGRFGGFISMGDKNNKNNEKTIFYSNYSNGVKTQRDCWCWNFSSEVLKSNIQRTISNYNECIDNGEMNFSEKKIHWTDSLKEKFNKKLKLQFDENSIVKNGMYRPFVKEYIYFSKELNERTYMLPGIFPEGNGGPVICVSGSGVKQEFSCLMTDCLPDLEIVGKSQCFPIRWYEPEQAGSRRLLSLLPGKKKEPLKCKVRDGVTDWILKHCRSMYRGKDVSKQDIFNYVYGLLHSREYRTEFSADLKKGLPRIPFPDSFGTFAAFAEAGWELSELHLHYETQKPWPGVEVVEVKGDAYDVEKMRWKSKEDKTELIVNDSITVRNIPIRVHDYILNGKSALDWLVDRYSVRTDQDSGIRNDPNAWGREHGNPRYILGLVLSVITVSMRTLEIVDGLPKLIFGEDGSVTTVTTQ